MAQQPRGRPPSQAPPPAGRGRNALTFLGGGVLMLAVAAGAVALFGRDEKPTTSARGTAGTSATPTKPVFGPVAPGKQATPAATATSTKPVAATPAATKAPSTAPSAAVPTAAPTPKATPPAAPPPAATPPVTGPQQSGTVAKRAYTFKVARGDTLWDFTEQALASTGRPTTNANVASYVAKLYQTNASVIGTDPDLILPGQTIVWPSGL